jgi:hypothetical protein
MTVLNTDILNKNTFNQAFDRDEPVDDLADTLREKWKYSLTDRRPGPAILADGGVKPTDLDLACLLGTLAERKAVVTLPSYVSGGTGSGSRNPNEQVLSGDRRGRLTSLTSNQDYFSMNIGIVDQSVQDLTTGELGKPRTMHVLGKDGNWHPGWDTINFVADAAENRFIKDYGLDVAAQIAFKNFVAPERWTAFYGQYYMLTKIVIDRLVDEARIVRARVKNLKAQMKSSNGEGSGTPFEKDESEKSFRKRSIEVPIFECEIDFPMIGDLPDEDSYDLEPGQHRLKWLEGMLSELRFATRATELAYYKANGKAGGYEKAGFPSWMRGARFEDETIKRTTWRRLTGSTIIPGCNLRYRVRKKEIEVATK